MEKKHLVSSVASNLLIDKFSMAMRVKALSEVEALPEDWAVLESILKTALFEQQWVDVALVAATLWHSEWKAHLGRDFLTEGNEPEHAKLNLPRPYNPGVMKSKAT
jgi:hypothetical protein